jgi:hypothetical protein
MQPRPTEIAVHRVSIFKFSLCLKALSSVAFASLMISTGMAQSITLKAQPLRVTIPKGVSGTSIVALTNSTSGFVTGWNLATTDVPAGVGATLSQTLINSNGTTAMTLTLTYDGSTAAGNYDMAVVASGDSSFRLPIPVQVAYVWSGINFTNAVSTNWNSAGNWKAGAVPGATDPVVFNDGGGQAATSPTNVVISSDQEVASVRFGPETGSSRFHNLEFQNGATLKVTGPGLSFSILRDSKLIGQQITTTIAGNGTLLVSNAVAQMGVLLEGQQNATLDMRNLDNFVADLVRMGLGDYRMYPNYYTNGYTGPTGANFANPPTRFVPLVWLAKTNVVKCSWVDPNNYNDGGIRDYAITVGNDEASGTTANIRFTLGLSNAFFIDSICLAQSGKGGGGNNFNFNAAGSYALFRGIGGGRMSVWAQGDASGNAASQSNVRGTGADFSNGQIDALVDRLYLGRSRTNTAGLTIQGTLSIGGASLGSVFDVNTAYLGAQDVLNIGTGAAAISGPVGTLNVNSNATFKANRDLHLGYTTAPVAGAPNYAENCSGILNINNTGTVIASNIVAGGVTKISVNNNIFMNRGNLVVSNAIGSADGRVNILSMTNGSQLTLYGVKGGESCVYVKTLSVPSIGAGSVLNIPSVANVSGNPFTIPVISYTTASPVISGLSVTPPAGLYVLSIVDNTANQTIDVTFSTSVPKTVVWRGNIDNNWDNTTKNWVTVVGGVQTNFADGDSVIFDDTATGSTSVNIPGTVAPGQFAAQYGIVVSNASYTFDGGSVVGSATVKKVGTGTLTINATFSPGVTLSQGSLAGAGTVGPTSLESGTAMTSYLGVINGGLASSNATVVVNGTVNGGLNLRAGSLTNSGTINGSVSLSGSTFLQNAALAIMNVNLPWSVPTNSVLANDGSIFHFGTVGGNLGLTVNGTLRGTGKITQNGNQLPSDVRVTIGAGGSLMIGNSPNEIASMTLAARVDFLATSVSTFDVDNSTPTNDVIRLADGNVIGKVNFGAGNELGGTFVINRTAGPEFGLGTTLYLFDRISNDPDNANPARPGVTPQPGIGMVWDVSNMLTNLTLAVTGLPPFSNTITSTNITFDWPENYRGWRLETQTNDLTVGISTNWATVGGSWRTNSVAVPLVTTNPAVFFRLAYP